MNNLNCFFLSINLLICTGLVTYANKSSFNNRALAAYFWECNPLRPAFLFLTVSGDLVGEI